MLTPAAKTKAAQCGLAVGVLGFVTGGMLLCDCPGWFFCAGIAAVLPSMWGVRLVRMAGICICIANFAAAIVQFRHERELNDRIERIRERAK
jgi:hypothetical protein